MKITRLDKITGLYALAFAHDSTTDPDEAVFKLAHRLDGKFGDEISPMIKNWQDGLITASEMVQKIVCLALAEATPAS